MSVKRKGAGRIFRYKINKGLCLESRDGLVDILGIRTGEDKL